MTGPWMLKVKGGLGAALGDRCYIGLSVQGTFVDRESAKRITGWHDAHDAASKVARALTLPNNLLRVVKA